MQTRVLTCAVAALALAPTLAAQEVRQQGNAAATLAWPSYTDAQRWNRSAYLGVSNWAGFIGFAKARGEGPDQVGRFFAERYASGWGPANSGVPIRVARAALFNFASFPNASAEIVSANDTMAVVRARRASYTAAFGPNGVMDGTTVAEYERTLSVFNQHLATHLGLRYADRIDGDWWVWTFSGRGSAGLTAFPRGGTFTATLTAEQAGGPEFAGTFEARFLENGWFELRDAAGAVKVRERYDVSLDQMALHAGTGEWACPGQTVGMYRFTPQANGDVVFGRLSDTCEGRVRFIGRRWVKR